MVARVKQEVLERASGLNFQHRQDTQKLQMTDYSITNLISARTSRSRERRNLNNIELTCSKI